MPFGARRLQHAEADRAAFAGPSGSPDGGFNIRIRGVATVNGSSDPLYVVDGVQDVYKRQLLSLP